jgi:CheY-like chemotaxis protein
MIFKLCPGCRSVTSLETRACAACGTALREHDTVPAPLPAPAGSPGIEPPGVLWLDDLQMLAASRAAPEPINITLRDVGPPLPQVAPRAVPRPVPASADELVASDPAPPGIGLPDIPAPPDAQALATLPAPQASKEARRAAVRRKRMLSAAEVSAAADTVPEILVVDADSAARGALCELLVGFGFGVQAVSSAGDAQAPLATRRFEAVFADIALDAADGGSGVELCHTVRRNGRRQSGEPTLLVLVTRPLRPVERVRAELVGCDEIVVKPAQRGDVARALDTRGVPLPADARRG